MSVFNKLLMANAMKQSPYSRIEYLETDGANYIDTLIKPIPADMGLILDFSILEDQTQNGGFLGCRVSSTFDGSTDCSILALQSSTSGQINLQMDGTCDGTVSSEPLQVGTRYSLLWENNTILLDGETYTRLLDKSESPLDYSIYLGTTNTGDIPEVPGCAIRIYSCIIYDGEGNILRDYIPVTNNSTSANGLWDRHTGSFYGLTEIN